MLCRESNYMVFTWNRIKNNDTYYFLKYQNIELKNHLFSKKTTCNKMLINNLTQNQTYDFQLFGISSASKTIFKTKKILERTVSFKEGKTAVKNLTYSLKYVGDMKNEIAVKWKMGEDRSCYYQIVFSYKDINEGGDTTVLEVNLEKTRKTEYIFKNLDFDKTYEVSVASFTPYRNQMESSKEFLYIRIPTCSETLRNLTVCVPDPPENLTLTEIESSNSTGRNYSSDLKVSWAKPRLLPDYYLLTYILPDQEGGYFTKHENCSGKDNAYTFEDVKATECLIQIIAHSKVGNSKPVWKKCSEKTANVQPIITDKVKWIWIFVIVSLSSLMLFMLIKFNRIFFKCSSIKTKQDNSDTSTNDKIWEESDKNNEEDKSKWELIESKLIVDKIIGSGAFGLVQKGFYHSEADSVRIPVAVKTLKARPTSEQIAQFYAEIEIMKSVPKHAHIVYLIGIVTKNRVNNPLMLVEYCSKGDLLSFLRDIGKSIVNRQELLIQTQYKNILPKDSMQVFNINYNNIEVGGNGCLQPKDLLSFARQITVGMEFLSNLKIVHRDLAARNILITDDNILKISDFGLSRDVYVDDIYRKVTGGKLPFKWMALESLTHQIYTTESDVWSFGIVLWEIITLGGNPYPIVKPENLVAALKDGYRMEKPSNCSDELYEVMCLCWQASPNLRPSFKDLRLIFEKILESEMQYVSFDGTNQYRNDVIVKKEDNIVDKHYKNVL
ncbi:tyrosine-protein kinase receptor torso-like [Anthonomus grandis grandis]|uniref:tyrosine-protein kinase receptor torso-like n=1 Tax=Anthonomus grandis grandis TaxID=2921223 RepID=UPI0021664F5A|nr:tyrosine-protein kinase receptor torso-like [Anthonomus grandis grandis]XP_050308481.1 tyrosine-protein kinase receptor torso-like [Anthonomus grandis grandis]XP_050308482.1 tyrosine-protein kinase receptor torso-like [Anthonomus grandis grandis]